MRSDLLRTVLAASSLVWIVACGGTGAGLDAARLPASMRAPYRRFEARCSRCHSLSRPLSAPVQSVEHWQRYLARMRRMPGSGINQGDAAMILEFLTYYTTVMRREEEAQSQGGEVLETVPSEARSGDAMADAGETERSDDAP
ncbi:hypothetical protein [Sandaracinus amylolyticus]|uniref:hypothetical protein n=1 Tax=Sandaracinus amylolyticus TaxID=927083 RepID=UPI001F304802|nr:hypothetical protein [Sandaracinus amylolyticus]UJR83292.1 Hypothetical protein I5071_53600 [Sandaracinus amylolyticus]